MEQKVSSIPKEHKDKHKHVDDIQVEIQCGEDIVVDGKLKLLVHAANHKLRVVDEVQRKDEDADPRVRHLRNAAAKAKRHETKDA